MALNASQLQILSDELRNDPLGRGYSTMSDDQARQDLNTEYRAYSRDLTVFDFEKLMRQFNKWDELKVLQEDRVSNPKTAELMDIFESRLDELDLRGHPNRVAKEPSEFSGWIQYGDGLLDAVVAEGSIGSLAAETAKEFCDTLVSRAWELVDQRVTTRDVERARVPT